jgi:acyl phosphate:glycerol-3-phosphate acyltransferase
VPDVLLAIVLVALGYLLGAIPFGLIVGRIAGVDPRQVGSRRTGATNVLRSVGRAGAAAVFLLDVLKGIAAVLVARVLMPGPSAEWVAAAAGVAAVIGHIRSVFIGFSGGRGVATATGGLLALAPWAVLVCAPVVVLAIWLTRYVSLGSILGACLAPVAVAILLLPGATTIPALAYAVAAAVLVTVAHADNIGRLVAGSERRLGEKEMVRPDG